MSHPLPIDVISDLESCPPITFVTLPFIPTLAYLNARGALIVAISHPFPPFSTVIIYKKGGLRWFAVVWDGLRYFDGAPLACQMCFIRFRNIQNGEIKRDSGYI